MTFLLALVSGFASGVGFQSLHNSDWPPLLFVVLLASILASAAFLVPRHVYLLGVVFFTAAACGMLRTTFANTPLPTSFTEHLRERVSYEGTVVGDPDLRDATQRFKVLVQHDTDEATLLVVTPRAPLVSVGEQVRVSGTLLVPEPFADDNGRVFRYDKYLQRDSVQFLLSFASVRILEDAPWYSIPAALARVKHAFLDGLAAALPEPHASLAGGVVIGGKSGLGSTLQNAFVRSGLVQIIVLSGYNVMVVAEWIMAALAYATASRRVRAGAGALALALFVGVAGLSATAVRAALMALIALYARATGRSYAAGRALLVAVLLMLLWNPLYLVFDPGFGLSVAATAGLIWLAPILETLFIRINNAFWKNVVATTLAAQTAVLPLLLFYTGNLSLVAVPANLIVMPIVPLVMGFSALAGFAGMLFGTIAPALSIALGLPGYVANAFILAVAQFSAALPFAAFTLPPFPFMFVIATYAALIAAASSNRFSTTVQLRFAKNASS